MKNILSKKPHLCEIGSMVEKSLLHNLEEALCGCEPFSIKLICSGFSMSPFIKDGDCVLIDPIGPKASRLDFHRGDIALAAMPGRKQVVVHRIIGKKTKQILLKGDNNISDDGWIPCSNLMGKVRTISRTRRDMFSPKMYHDSGQIRFLIAVLSKAGVLAPGLHLIRQLKNWISNTRQSVGHG